MYASQKSAAALAAGKPLVDASGKELKPTLSSGLVRTRKRNIQTKRDPEAFRNRLLEVFDEAVRSPCLLCVMYWSALACMRTFSASLLRGLLCLIGFAPASAPRSLCLMVPLPWMLT